MANISKIKVSGVTYDIVDSSAIHSLDGYWNSGETQSAITAATSALAEAIAEQGYQTSGDVQNAISGKADTTAVTQAISEATSGKLDTSTFATYSGNVDTALASKFAGASWNSTDKKIYFYDNASNTGTALAYIDGTDFVKDGFLSSVTIDNRTISGESVPCLVFIWNTDSGIQETDIPLTDIFNPDNFYDKTEIDTIVSGINEDISAVSEDVATKQNTLTAGDGIQITNDVISVTGIPNVDQTVISGSTNPVAGGAVYTELQGKQATLVNQTNIKSINNESLLGSGNISTLQASVSGSTLILS